MRIWLTVLLVAGCADAAEPNYCEIGEDAYSEAVTALQASSNAKACSSDDECVHISTDVGCNGFSASLCGAVVHRDAVPLWNPKQVCSELDAYPPAKTGCDVQASCAAGEPVCERRRCTSSAYVQRPLDSGVKLDAGRDASDDAGD